MFNRDPFSSDRETLRVFAVEDQWEDGSVTTFLVTGFDADEARSLAGIEGDYHEVLDPPAVPAYGGALYVIESDRWEDVAGWTNPANVPHGRTVHPWSRMRRLLRVCRHEPDPLRAACLLWELGLDALLPRHVMVVADDLTFRGETWSLAQQVRAAEQHSRPRRGRRGRGIPFGHPHVLWGGAVRKDMPGPKGRLP